MSLGIRVPEAATATTAREAKDGAAKTEADIGKVSRDFEAILVRQMLSQTRIAGKGGYADMGVEALATAIGSAGGLGMARAIEQALSHHAAPATSSDRG